MAVANKMVKGGTQVGRKLSRDHMILGRMAPLMTPIITVGIKMQLSPLILNVIKSKYFRWKWRGGSKCSLISFSTGNIGIKRELHPTYCRKRKPVKARSLKALL